MNKRNNSYPKLKLYKIILIIIIKKEKVKVKEKD